MTQPSKSPLKVMTGYRALEPGKSSFTIAPKTSASKADKLPMTGNYDGKKIVFTVKGSNNDPSCKDYTLTFFRGKDHYFEREAPDGSWKMYFDPN